MLLVSKTDLMSRVARGHCHEAFEHSIEGRFDITLMRQKALDERRTPQHVPVTADIIQFLMTNRVWEEARVQHFIDKAAENWEPAMLVCYKGDVHLIVDGAHRLIAGYRLALPDMKAAGTNTFLASFWVFDESEIIRPQQNWVPNPHLDWGDEMTNGQIIKRT